MNKGVFGFHYNEYIRSGCTPLFQQLPSSQNEYHLLAKLFESLYPSFSSAPVFPPVSSLHNVGEDNNVGGKFV